MTKEELNKANELDIEIESLYKILNDIEQATFINERKGKDGFITIYARGKQYTVPLRESVFIQVMKIVETDFRDDLGKKLYEFQALKTK